METAASKSAAKRQQRKAERKTRSTLSCEACRSRKLKCNREQPCQNCTVRDKAASCVYRGETAPQHGKRHVQTGQAEDMQTRIDRLESLVTTLVEQNQQLGGRSSSQGRDAADFHSDQITPSNSDASDNDNPIEEIQHGVGIMQVDEKQSIYKGSTHWYDVLEELNELKSLWGHMKETQDVAALYNPSLEVPDAPSLLCGMARPLMARFFDDENSPVPTYHLLHQPSFMRQYEEHWADPSKTSIMWLGLLFSMLSPIMFSYHSNDDEPPEYEGTSRSLSELYRVRTTQCLMMGDITKCAPFTLETLVYNSMAEWARKTVSETRVWMMVGLVVRVALQMGYHRDPSQFPDISVFQGEMRRRLWQFVHRMDSLTSFLTGLPGMIRNSDIDTAEPINIYDWQLTEDMTELPPPQPETAPTPVSYLLAKGRIIRCLGHIMDFLSALGQYPYSEVMKLDEQMVLAFDAIPPFLRMQGTESSLGPDSESLVNRRVQLVFLHHQGMCVLHRKFFIRGRSDARFAPSYNRCISSAVALLELQDFLYTSANASFLIATHWYRISYTSHEFILAAMIIVLDIRNRKMERENGLDAQVILQPECLSVLPKLYKAYQIWKDEGTRKRSPEAIKVSQVLSNLLVPLGFFDYIISQPESIQDMPEVDNQILSFMPSAGQHGIPEAEMDIDWGVWDSFIEGTSFEDAYGEMTF
ncbi:fungal-specific transcription factor domain-containing protein [Rhexocercosporidium sp. MPI-PUGE-AT-0058]|nr:fungal-specific transcription factor domain-containing protein [Rhexocercosporidium sp. MPI-PUGE-AT-0058]